MYTQPGARKLYKIPYIHLQAVFFNGPFPASFWILFFLGSLLILKLTNFDNGDRKQERRRKRMHAPFYSSFFR